VSYRSDPDVVLGVGVTGPTVAGAVVQLGGSACPGKRDGHSGGGIGQGHAQRGDETLFLDRAAHLGHVEASGLSRTQFDALWSLEQRVEATIADWEGDLLFVVEKFDEWIPVKYAC
jgi:hypothetical protein